MFRKVIVFGKKWRTFITVRGFRMGFTIRKVRGFRKGRAFRKIKGFRKGRTFRKAITQKGMDVKKIQRIQKGKDV